MIFLHTSDWHIGESWKILPKHWLKRQSLMIDNIYEIARLHGIRAIAVCGDLFHRREPTRECRDLILSKLLQYDDDFTTIIMEGNHDTVDVHASAVHFLKILYERKRFKNTIIVELKNKIIPYEDGAFLVIPLFNPQKLEEMIACVSGQYKWLIAMIHSATIGVKDDKGWQARSGWDMKPVPRITYYAFGHIHRFQRLALQNAFQCGSPIQHRFDEKLPKGVVVVNTEDPCNPKLISLKKVPPLYVVREDEEIPKNGFVYLVTKKNLLGKKLPPNVVASGQHLEEVEIMEYDSTLNPLKGLPEYLAHQGLSKEEQFQGIRLVESLVKKVVIE